MHLDLFFLLSIQRLFMRLVHVIELCFNWFRKYFLFCNKNIRFDFDDKLEIGDVRYDNIT